MHGVSNFFRAYIRHLHVAKEALGIMSIHNIAHVFNLIEGIKQDM